MIGLTQEDEKSLIKRYLFWLYKTIKDELDKIDRKFTQLRVDKDIQKLLKKWASKAGARNEEALEPFLKEWQEYVFQKDSDAQRLKFDESGCVSAAYLFLHMKFAAVCQITRSQFGPAVLKEFKRLYEEAALKRILGDESGKR